MQNMISSDPLTICPHASSHLHSQLVSLCSKQQASSFKLIIHKTEGNKFTNRLCQQIPNPCHLKWPKIISNKRIEKLADKKSLEKCNLHQQQHWPFTSQELVFLTLNGILMNKITTPCSKDFSQDPWGKNFRCYLYVCITWKWKENRTKNPSPQNPITFAPGTLTTQSSSKNGECTKEDRQTDRPVQERLERKKLTIAWDASEATGRQADPDSEKCDTNAKT